MLGHVTDPEAPGGLARRERPEPEPAPHEVVVAVRAYAVNRGELRLLEDRPDGWAPGQDVAGVVAAAAADGSGPPEGARVVGLADGGGWSERVAVPTHRVAVLPDAVDFAQAAGLPVAGLTALRALETGGRLLGRRVLVTGASGGVGSFAVQLARAAGAHVTGHVSGEHRIEDVRALGADAVITAIDEDAGPFDLVLDGVGGPVLLDAVHRLAPGGTATAYGVAGGREPTPLHFFDFAPLARLIGFFIYGTDERTFGRDLGVLAGLVADGRLTVPRGVEADWTETATALDALRERRVAGKVVLTIAG
jgi:NADPH2:quinone reductase